MELKTLEYKSALPGNSDAEKKEFLADVSSFANASGGDIVYGISEGRAASRIELTGLTSIDPDAEVQRLESSIRNGIQPRIPGLHIRPVPLGDDKIALVLRCPRSWMAPHRVTYGGHDKFYGRGSNGKYPLDVSELRGAFVGSETATQRIRAFREERVAAIVAGETPVPMLANPQVILHMIPLNAFAVKEPYDLEILMRKPAELRPIASMGLDVRYNMDGILAYAIAGDDACHSYVQFYRSGIVEAVESRMLQPRKEARYIPGGYESEVVEAASLYMQRLREMGVSLPIIVVVTLAGVKNYRMGLKQRFYSKTFAVDRDILLLPDVLVDQYDAEAPAFLRQVFDAVWNACGHPRSLNYDTKGKWITQR